MNTNEVVANRALELMGHRRGDYAQLHPLEHVNLSRSTNDTYPTAIKIALQVQITRLHATLMDLALAFRAKAHEFSGVIKMGRTQLQDAVPMTLGQEFGTYAVMVTEDAERLFEAGLLVSEINLGGTAIGTGLNADPRYPGLVCEKLSELTGLALVTASDLVEATQDVGAFVQVSGVLKHTALKLSKICNDLRLLSSGPRTGLNEINLPAVQAGSSIMPGKVNPVIPEAVNQVAFEVVGNDVTISMAAEAGQLQLNAFETDHRSQPVQIVDAPRRGEPITDREVRHRHHGRRRAVVRVGGEFDRRHHCAQPVHRVRRRGQDCQPRARIGQAGPGAGGRAGTVVPQPGNRAVATRIIRRAEAIADHNSHTRIEGFA